MHNGKVDVVSALWSLAKRHVPLDVLRSKLADYVLEKQLDQSEADELEPVLEQMYDQHRQDNIYRDSAQASTAALDAENKLMDDDELARELNRREEMMQSPCARPAS